MQVVYERCCGIDVHKKLVVACMMVVDATSKLSKQIRSFSTMTADLLELADWLLEQGCQKVAMESTGIYWKPVFNLLEAHLEVIVVNAAHMKAIPGKKTDVKDSEWICDLLAYGLLKPSFIPPQVQRQLRDLTRYRSQLVSDRTRLINRLHKVLEDANLKLSAVATDVTGVSGRAILARLLEGESDVSVLAGLARGKLLQKRNELERALTGRVAEHHRFLLIKQLAQLDFFDEQIEEFSTEIGRRLSLDIPPAPELTAPIEETGEEDPGQVRATAITPNQNESEVAPGVAEKANIVQSQAQLSNEQAIGLLDTIPGINRRVAEVLIAEIGSDTRISQCGPFSQLGQAVSGQLRKCGQTQKWANGSGQSLAQADYGGGGPRCNAYKRNLFSKSGSAVGGALR